MTARLRPGVSEGDKQCIAAVRQWVEVVVVGMNLCPFAKRELARGKVRFTVTSATTPADLLSALGDEIKLLDGDEAVETTLLIHPHVLKEFADYNQFLDEAEDLLVRGGWEGVYQVASFHPQYQFAGTAPGDAENYTNRSPYPLLHLIRESSLERAVESYPDAADIPERNIALMNQLSPAELADLVRFRQGTG